MQAPIIRGKTEQEKILDAVRTRDDATQILIEVRKPFFDPPCCCHECQDHFYTKAECEGRPHLGYTRKLNDIEAKSFLRTDVEEIQTSHAYVKHAVEVHGDAILTAWRKRSPAKRAAILREAEPELSKEKGLSAELKVQGYTAGSDWSRYRKYLLAPYLDIAALSKNPATFIGLVHARAASSPEEWAFYDSDQLRSAWSLGVLKVAYHGGAVVMHGGSYGTLTQWEAGAAHRGDVMGFPRASLVIEAQAVLIKLLRQSIASLLEGVQATGGGNSHWNEVIHSGLKMSNDIVS